MKTTSLLGIALFATLGTASASALADGCWSLSRDGHCGQNRVVNANNCTHWHNGEQVVCPMAISKEYIAVPLYECGTLGTAGWTICVNDGGLINEVIQHYSCRNDGTCGVYEDYQTFGENCFSAVLDGEQCGSGILN